MRPRSDLNLRVRSLLADGPLTMAQIARALDKRSSDVRDVVKDLVKHEWVVNLNPNPHNIPARKHPGVYQLTDRCDTHIAPASKPAPRRAVNSLPLHDLWFKSSLTER